MRKLIARLERAHPGDDAETVAKLVLTELADEQRQMLLIELITRYVRHARRDRLRTTVERRTSLKRGRRSWTHPRYAPRNSREHRGWLQTEEGQEYARMVCEEADREHAWQERIATEGAAAVYVEYRDRILARFTEGIRREVTLTLTQERLDTIVSLYDGTEVRFGDMTVEQHMIRADHLSALGKGVGDTIADHLEAGRLLVEGGAPNLRQITRRTTP